MILTRTVLGWQHLITIGHLERMAKIMLVTGGIVGLAYGTEFFVAWYSGNRYERFAFANRAFGPYAWAYWTMVSCNVFLPQLLWLRRVRTSAGLLFALSIVVNVGMWFERFVIIVTSLHRDFLPSSWAMYRPTAIEVGTLVGSFGLFFSLFLAFTRLLPMVSMAELKGVLGYAHHRGADVVPGPGPHEKTEAVRKEMAA
jgi:molybdopterin-containing oxidoreductase family membrane subunit